MLYHDADAFLAEPHKCITLIGMSNVGKTWAAARLPKSAWFHYSVDYRLATAHLREDIVDTLKAEMMQNPRLARHLRDEAMCVDIGVSFTNLAVLSHYLGMIGDPALGGLPEAEFRRRLERHRAGEIAAILDLPAFIARGRRLYGYPHFVNDASGSLCEVIEPDDPADPVLAAVLTHTMLVYIVADEAHEAQLVAAARTTPKPLYYRPAFLDAALAEFVALNGLAGASAIDPDAFARWVFPRLLAARRPRYAAIARHGYQISARQVAGITGEGDFLNLIAEAIARGERPLALPDVHRAA
jgi:hypothetical protein